MKSSKKMYQHSTDKIEFTYKKIYNNANVSIHLLKKTYKISKIYNKIHKIKPKHKQNVEQKLIST